MTRCAGRFGRWTKTSRRLVRKGVRFRRGYAAMPLCGPARASILTSLYVHDHGCDTNLTHPRFVARGLDRDTVATRMHAAGYDTGYFGKYMNGHGQQPSYVAPGWDRWVTVVMARPRSTSTAMSGRSTHSGTSTASQPGGCAGSSGATTTPGRGSPCSRRSTPHFPIHAES